MLKYKGYTGYVVYDDIVGLKVVITFQGTTVDEIDQAFTSLLFLKSLWSLVFMVVCCEFGTV